MPLDLSRCAPLSLPRKRCTAFQELAVARRRSPVRLGPVFLLVQFGRPPPVASPRSRAAHRAASASLPFGFDRWCKYQRLTHRA